MSRRCGKAASRKARQQRRARQAQAPGQHPSPGQVSAVGPPAAESAAGPSSADAGYLSADSAPSAVAATPAPARPVPQVAGMSSRLGEAAQLEYHYVGRDLRNTFLLVLIMAALLAGAVILVNLTGVAPS